MASLTSGLSLGTGSVSSLLKSSSTLQTQLADYQDQIHALDYANSAYTDDAFAAYQTYLQGRINQLNTTGTVANASKALTLTKTLEGAMKSNISASITRENIAILTGNASNQDKYNLIVSQYSRAINNGDLTLAQTLEKQAYDLNQTIQYQQQQAASAAATLAKAGNGTTTGTSGASYQSAVSTNLGDTIKYLNGLAKNTGSKKEVDAVAASVAQQYKPQLQALGVNLKASSPNYFDLIQGLAGAQYQATVLESQAYAGIGTTTDTIKSRDLAETAVSMLNGTYKWSTLGGNLNIYELQQAQQDPNMFTFNSTTGQYTKDVQTGWQYMAMNTVDANGNVSQGQVLVPKYGVNPDTKTGIAAQNATDFLTTTEVTTMNKLNLQFSQTTSGASKGTTGNGVQFDITAQTPDWFKSVVGESGILNMYQDPTSGFVQFKASSSTGQGESIYTLAQDAKGLHGLYEHLPDGTTRLSGGDYGFNASAVNLLISKGQQTQYQVQLAQQQAQAKLQMAQQQAQQQLQVQQAQAKAATAAKASQAQTVQRTASPQPPTINPQGNNVNPQPATGNPQGNNYNPQQGGTNAGTLHVTGGQGIKL